MDGDIHRLPEPLGRAVDDAAMQIGLGREGDGMQDRVDPPPFAPDLFEHILHLPRRGNVERQLVRSAQFLGERAHMRLGARVQPGHRQLRPLRAKGPRAAIGDRLRIRDPDDENLLTFE